MPSNVHHLLIREFRHAKLITADMTSYSNIGRARRCREMRKHNKVSCDLKTLVRAYLCVYLFIDCCLCFQVFFFYFSILMDAPYIVLFYGLHLVLLLFLLLLFYFTILPNLFLL